MRRSTTTAAAIAAGWIGLELALRRGLVAAVGTTARRAIATDWLILLVGFPAIAVALSAAARRRGVGPSAWGYDRSARRLAAGFGGGIVVLVGTFAAIVVDATLFGGATGSGGVGGGLGGSGGPVADVVAANPILAVVFVLGNGIAVPIAEEHVWRGIVQSELVDARGAAVGIAATALAFALKHVVVDGSVARLTTLLVLAVGVGLLRHRFGTTASTVAHVVVNLIASAGLLALFLG